MVRRSASAMLVLLLIGAAIAFRVNGGSVAHADVNGNAGDTKISQFTYPDNGNQGNEPHVACAFYVLGFNFAASQGFNKIVSWSPTGDGTLAKSDTYTGTPDGSGNYQFVNGPYYLNPGHYKNYVTDNKGLTISKQKVFWVDGPCSPPPPPCNPTATVCGSVVPLATSYQPMNLSHMRWSHIARHGSHVTRAR